MIIKETIDGTNQELEIFFIERNTARMRLETEINYGTRAVKVYAIGPKKDLKRWYDRRIKQKFANQDNYEKRATRYRKY
jgi:hypothetical protein|tara:strand:- start:2229 stop:2465 length:237 start_codon:yes stop_codon:yes gene_type:complete